jgi:hypothetical protein
MVALKKENKGGTKRVRPEWHLVELASQRRWIARVFVE